MNKNLRDAVEKRRIWDKRFMQIAYCVRGWSKDPSAVGAVLVDPKKRINGTGYNGFPASISDKPERLTDKELKNHLTIHAELNAIFNSANSTDQNTLFSTRFPCHECAKAIIQSGIIRVVSPGPDIEHPRWGSSQSLAVSMFAEAGIELTTRA